MVSREAPTSEEAFILEDRARALLESGDTDGALALAQEALALDASRSGACEVAVDVCMQQGLFAEGVALLQGVVEAQPEQVWPYALIAEICAASRPDDGDTAEQALNVASLPDARQAADVVRQLLRKADLWEALARHLEHQMDTSLDIRHQIALHDELADLHGIRLQDQAQSRAIRARGDLWRDIPQLVATYWQGLESEPDSPEVWDEAEQFFRQNNLAEDLARLLEHSLLGAGPEEMVDRFDDLVETYHRIAEPDWAHLAALLKDASAAAPKPFAGRLRERLAEAEKEASKQRKREAGEPTSALETNLPPMLVFVAAASIGFAIAAWLIIRFLA